METPGITLNGKPARIFGVKRPFATVWVPGDYRLIADACVLEIRHFKPHDKSVSDLSYGP